MLGAAVSQLDFGAHGGEQATRRFNVADLGNVFEDNSVFGKQGGSHAGERGVFRAADAHCAQQGCSAADD